MYFDSRDRRPKHAKIARKLTSDAAIVPVCHNRKSVHPQKLAQRSEYAF